MFHEHSKRADHDYQVKDKYFKVADRSILSNDTAFKDEIPYNGPFEITQCWTNGTVTLHAGVINNSYIIGYINPYKYDTNLDNYLL